MRLFKIIGSACLIGLAIFSASLSWALPIISIDANPFTGGIQNSLTVNPGETFTVDIVISGLTQATPPIQFFEFDVAFDNTVLNATTVVSGGFLTGTFGQASSPQTNTNFPEVEFDLTAFGLATNNAALPLARIDFQVLSTASPGTSLLDLNDVKLTEPFFPSPFTGALIPQGTPAGANITVSGGGPAPIPEPTTILLLGTGLAGLAGYRWAKRNP